MNRITNTESKSKLPTRNNHVGRALPVGYRMLLRHNSEPILRRMDCKQIHVLSREEESTITIVSSRLCQSSNSKSYLAPIMPLSESKKFTSKHRPKYDQPSPLLSLTSSHKRRRDSQDGMRERHGIGKTITAVLWRECRIVACERETKLLRLSLERLSLRMRHMARE